MNDSQNVATRVQKAPSLGFLSLSILVGLTAISASAWAQTSDSTTTPPADAAAAPPADATPPADAAAPTGTAAPDSSATPAETTTTTTTTTSDDGASTTTTSEAQALGDGASTTTTTTTTTDAPATTTESTSTNPDEAAEEVQAAREPLAWRNSFFNYSINASFCSFSRDCQLSYNPTVYQFISLSPRWYLDNDTFFSFSIYGLQEWTQDDGATYQNEFQMFDGRISLTRRFAVSEHFMILPSAGFWLPFSKSSQAAQRYLRLGAGISATWVPGVAGFNVSLLASYYRWLAGSNVALAGSPYPASGLGGNASAGVSIGGATGGPQDVSNQASAVTSEVDRVTAGMIANLQPIDGTPFTITLLIYYFWAQGYPVAPVTFDSNGSSFSLPDSSNHWRAFDSYSIYFQYDFVPWLQGWIGFSNSTQLAAVFNPDGSARSPVDLYDMQVAIGTTIQMDALYESVAVAGEDDGLTPEQRQRRRQGLARRSTSGGSL